MFNQPEGTDRKGPCPVLYLGDTSLDSAAAYLAGMMAFHGIDFDYVSSGEKPSRDQLTCGRKLFILSDYMARLLTEPSQRTILERVEDGAGLLMIGGWESYCGLGGEWMETPIAEALPVKIAGRDDRVNFDQVALLAKVQDHPILEGLPWDERPPAIGGFNRFEARPGSQLLLNVCSFRVQQGEGAFRFVNTRVDPALVAGRYGKGRTAALATDLAPHWVGPLVDWGTENDPDPSAGGRVQTGAPGAEPVEVGRLYARFVYQLLAWTGRLE